MTVGRVWLIGVSTDGVSGMNSGSAAGEASTNRAAAGTSDKNDAPTPEIPGPACETVEGRHQPAINKSAAWRTSDQRNARRVMP